MKAKVFLLCAALFCAGQVAMADDVLTVASVTLPQGGETVIEISGMFATSFKGFEMDIELSDGLKLALDSDDKPATELAFSGTDHSVSASQVGDGKYRFVCVSMSNKLLPSSGTLLRVRAVCPNEATVSTVYSGKLTNMEFTTTDMQAQVMGEVMFSVTVGEPADTRIVLDELSTTPPVVANGVDVRVKRTINGGEWNTLVLPFDMTEVQVKEAFGNDVQLADFAAWESEENNEGDIVGISVTFNPISELPANHPCLIKTSSDITEFTVDGVDIEPEDEPSVQVGKKKAERGYLIGTYTAGTSIPEENLFISGNKFWYSTGATQTMAFRAYFEFADVLTAYYERENANVRIFINTDQITGPLILTNSLLAPTQYYDLQGRPVNKPTSGIYILNGKKVIIK
ncbi:MAG: hypothetical protein IKI05_05365 [Bacteroidaceae bacterium]|nr:hypothetical protein [Bacteroidaceae bacterium]